MKQKWWTLYYFILNINVIQFFLDSLIGGPCRGMSTGRKDAWLLELGRLRRVRNIV